jgi:hypothetical protein
VKSLVLSILILLLVAIPTIGRQDDPVRCVITLYDLRARTGN